MKNNYLTELLDKKHKKEEFDCGVELLNGYFKRQVSQDIKRKLAACFVIASADNCVVAFYTLSSASIPRTHIPIPLLHKLPSSYVDLPVTLLGRMAVDTKNKGQGWGELLLIDALRRAFITSLQQVGSMAVVVDPIDDVATQFYQKYGFIQLPDSGKLFIPMSTIALLIENSFH